MSKRGGVGLFFVIVLFLVAIFVLVVFLFNLYSKPDPLPVNETLVNKTYFNISLKSDNVLMVDYVLFYNGSDKVRGVLFPGMREEYNYGIENGTNVTFKVFGDKYYFRETQCNITYERQICVLNATLKAFDYEVGINSSDVFFTLKNGLIQRPMICFIETPRFLNVEMDLEEVSKPYDLVKKVDFCYRADDINSSTSFAINIKFNEFITQPGLLKVLVRDSEKIGFSNIGDKQAGIII